VLERPGSRNGLECSDENSLDRACLLFGVSLIDHMFISDIFESVVIDLFVVSGTDAKSKSSSRLPTPRRFFRV
jgi:hypothetical protein